MKRPYRDSRGQVAVRVTRALSPWGPCAFAAHRPPAPPGLFVVEAPDGLRLAACPDHLLLAVNRGLPE